MELDQHGRPIYDRHRDHHPANELDGNGLPIVTIMGRRVMVERDKEGRMISSRESLHGDFQLNTIKINFQDRDLEQHFLERLKEKENRKQNTNNMQLSDFSKFKEQMLSDADTATAYISKSCGDLRRKTLRVEEVLPAMVQDFAKKEDCVVLKYHNGQTYYLIHANSDSARALREGDQINVPLMHMLSGKLFIARCFDVKVVDWNNIPYSFQVDACALNPILRNLFTEDCKLTHNNNNNQKQNQMLKNMFSSLGSLGMDFGKIDSGTYAIAMTGQVAIKSPKGEGFIVYDKPNRQLIEVGGLKMDVDFYKVPSQTVGDGDLILIDGKPLYVEKVNSDGSITGINPTSGTRSTKIKRTNMFGFNFYTKIVSMLDMFKQGGGQGFNPMMALAMSEGNSGDMMGMMMMGQMMSGGNAGGSMFPFMNNNNGAAKRSSPRKKSSKKAASSRKK